MSKWPERFIQMAEFVSQWSKDPSTKCGAVIVGEDNEVLSTGFNGFPRGVEETDEYLVGAGDAEWMEEQLNDRWKRPPEGPKYEYVEHAERNAIYNAARTGVRTAGATMYLNYAVECCADCTRAIIQAGIRRVVGPNRPFPGKGKHIYKAGADEEGSNQVMFREAGVEVEHIDADV